MVRMFFAVAFLGFVAATTGCRMCMHPYDYCGPVWTEGRCQTCNPDYRAGSILVHGRRGGYVAPVPKLAPVPAEGTTPAPEAAPSEQSTSTAGPAAVQQVSAKMTPVTAAPSTPKTIPAPPGTAAGTTRILSVTDRKVCEDEVAKQDTAKPETAQHETVGWRPVRVER